ncbi:MAG TPA: hypothetical protein VM489_00050 [Burkholderiales bacterium]|nr:hypothetical protein [Burkholderiales bacterium]
MLNPRIHGVLDYALAVLFLLMPVLFNFTQTAATLSYIIGVLYLGASLLTKYPLGALKLIPFPVHGVLETIMAAGWIVFPWLFGFAADAAARNWFVIAGIGLLAVVVLTDYRSTGARTAFSGQERRHRNIDRRQRYMAVDRERRMGLADRRRYAAA